MTTPHHDDRVRLFDAHLHVIDPRFPLEPNQGFVPEPFTVEDYRARVARFDVAGGAVVAGSFQGVRQDYLVDALRALGPGFVGVTQLPPGAPDDEILRLDAAGVRALRFNLFRMGAQRLDDIERLARRVHDLAGWHAELYVDSAALPDLAAMLRRLPRVAIDHLGLTPDAFDELLRLAEGGAHVKATGFGRVTLDVPAALRALDAANPSALVFGTDLPSTRARRPFHDDDVALILDCLGDDAGRRVLLDNGIALYQRAQ